LRNERVKTWKHIAFQIVVYVYKLKLTAYTLLAISQFNRFDILLYSIIHRVYSYEPAGDGAHKVSYCFQRLGDKARLSLALRNVVV
jgi:hypothetical protein